MKNDEGWAAALTAVVVGGAVALAIASDVAAPACRAAKAAIGLAKDFDFGCVEFWLNRYQGLMAAFIGGGVALYVVRPVYRQLRTMNRQTAGQLMDQAERLARELEAEREILRTFKTMSLSFRNLWQCYKNDNPHIAHSGWSEQFEPALDLLRTINRSVVSAEIRSKEDDPEAIARTKFIDCLTILETAAWRLNTCLISQTSGLDPSEGEVAPTSAETIEVERRFTNALGDATLAYNQLYDEHRCAIRRAWAYRNRLRDEAFAA